MIKEWRLTYTVSMLCRVLDVAPSGYDAWTKRRLSNRDQSEMRLELEIRAAHKRTRQTYGPERLQRDLADNGIIFVPPDPQIAGAIGASLSALERDAGGEKR